MTDESFQYCNFVAVAKSVCLCVSYLPLTSVIGYTSLFVDCFDYLEIIDFLICKIGKVRKIWPEPLYCFHLIIT